MSRPRLPIPWIALGALLLICTALHCSGTVHENAVVDSGVEDVYTGMEDTGSPDTGPSDGGKVKSTIQGVGSKCLTVCPQHLTCDPYKWKGFCTKTCSTDSDCQGTGVPPVMGVCGSDGRCYKACDPVSNPCTRTLWSCVGEAGDTYCNNYYDAHYVKPGSEGGDAPSDDASGDDASSQGDAPAQD